MKEKLIFFSDMPGNRVHVIDVDKGEVNVFACLNSFRSFASSVQAKINNKFFQLSFHLSRPYSDERGWKQS